MQLSEYIIGTTIVALSTSLPEFFVSINAAVQGVGVISLANVVGSNIYNIALIFMLLCIFSKNIFKITWKKIMFLSLLNLMLLGMSIYQVSTIPRILGVVFLCVLIIMSIFSYTHQGKQKHTIPKLSINDNATQEMRGSIPSDTKKNSILMIAIRMFLGMVLLYFGSEFFLNSTRAIGIIIHIPDSIIGIIFIALGTSLPELMVTITAIYYMKKGTHNANFQDMAEGNILGSNIFNILGVLGLTTVIVPIEGIASLLFDIIIMTMLTGLLFFLLMQKLLVQKCIGAILGIMLIMYISYITVVGI